MMVMMVLLPFTTFFMWPIGILLMLLWIFQGNWREKWENFKTNNGIPYGFFLLSICLIPLTGFINSSHLAMAWSYVECYLWFLFTPLIFLTASPKIWKKEHFDVLLALFSAGVVVYLITLFVHGIYKTVTTGDSIYMYNFYFCYNNHHSYVALYLDFVYILIFNYLLHNQHKMKIIRIILLYVIEIILIAGVFCVYSRAGIISFLCLQLVWGIYAIYLKRSRWKIILGTLLLIIGLSSVFVITSPTNRFTYNSINLKLIDDGKKEPDLRLIIWQTAWDAIVESLPWGTGTGDGNYEIMEHYRGNGQLAEDPSACNAHNQFLSVLLSNGVPGLVIILLYFYTPLALAIKHRDMMLLSIFLLMLINCFVECMFERRAGVDFFAIMIPLFILKVHIPENPLTE